MVRYMSESISEIKKIISNTLVNDLNTIIEKYSKDNRQGVVKLVESARKKQEKYFVEIKRTKEMLEYENMYSQYQYICGIDEVGRGPLAGPVVAAAVILPKDMDILYLNDSKQLSAKKREELYVEIYEKAISVGIGMADVDVIDDINILQADYVAMRSAISKLKYTPDILLNDAVTIPDVNIMQVPIIKGDTKSASIAAASIIAKVTRDKLMVEYADIYKEYDFANNKGYGSQKHIDALKKYGPCDIHRRTFIKNFI